MPEEQNDIITRLRRYEDFLKGEADAKQTRANELAREGDPNRDAWYYSSIAGVYRSALKRLHQEVPELKSG